MSAGKRPLEARFLRDLDRWFGLANSLFEYNPGGYCMPAEFEAMLPRILDSEVREDDVWLVSYPRSGSTWIQEIVWLIGNNFDFDKARNIIQYLRAPQIEMDLYFAHDKHFCEQYGSDSVEFVNKLPSPRFLKTHLSYDFLPTQFDKVKPKLIYISRNPKDVYCSYYTHLQMFHNLDAPFDRFAEYYMAGMAPVGCPIAHALPYWNRRHDPNLLFLRFEDAKADPDATIRRIAKFLGMEISEDEVRKVREYGSVERMRENPGVNMGKYIEYCDSVVRRREGRHFIGRGEIGSWKGKMSEELSREFDAWIERKTRDTDLRY